MVNLFMVSSWFHLKVKEVYLLRWFNDMKRSSIIRVIEQFIHNIHKGSSPFSIPALVTSGIRKFISWIVSFCWMKSRKISIFFVFSLEKYIKSKWVEEKREIFKIKKPTKKWKRERKKIFPKWCGFFRFSFGFSVF